MRIKKEREQICLSEDEVKALELIKKTMENAYSDLESRELKEKVYAIYRDIFALDYCVDHEEKQPKENIEDHEDDNVQSIDDIYKRIPLAWKKVIEAKLDAIYEAGLRAGEEVGYYTGFEAGAEDNSI